jgi:tetratricopeptide (TPR) repeat protein/tRNA A-37 threonylcarbamoyl transferase component Bud32
MSDWQRVQSIFLASADLPAETRDCVLDELCVGDAELRSEVESLLRADGDSSATIESAIQGVASTMLDTPVLIGERLGAYRIVREIGRGGMGSVYLALRDDDEYTKEVALKVVKRGMNTEEVLRRFRDERQILANLDHPYVARLFDGGTTADGVPFFAMEYVEGRPVDVFCREQSLSVKARCDLFLHILEAVAYAHRRLVVHGDLKPANIFVTVDGTPKLLDFGVAKLMGNEQGDVAVADARVFTPGYASPEQVRGTAVTTSTDIYSLGAVLYELLSGERAQPVDFDTPTRIEHAVCDVDVLRPSLVARDLPADLDDVVLMALHKEPERRYQSAEQFAEDIRRCLDGRPVIAKENSAGYRAHKFIVRNRLKVAMAAVVAVALIGGLVVSLAETRRARVEKVVAESERRSAVRERSEAEEARAAESNQRDLAEQQRRLAEEQRALALNERDDARSQKAIADQRFQEIMKLAEHTLFDIHDDIASLPGSMAARRKIIQTTLDYFESLQKTVGDNDDIRQALVAAYYKIALIQGSPRGASLQDSAGAEETLRKAQAVLLPAYHRHPGDSGLVLRWFEIRTLMADLIYRSGRPQEGIQMYVELLPLAHRLPHFKGCNMVCETQEPAIEIGLSNLLVSYDPEAALQHANRAIELNRDLVARHPTDPGLKQALAVGLAVAAASYRDTGDLNKASEYFLQSIGVREELLRDKPGDMFISHNLMVAYGNYALLLGVPWSPNLGRPAEARVYAGKAAAIARGMLNAEPKDATAHRDLAVALGRLGMIDPGPGEVAESLAQLQEAKELVEPIAEANPKSFDLASQLALILHYEGHRLEELGRMPEAEQAYRKSMALYEPFIHQPNLQMVADYIADQDELALLYASTGKKAAAMDMADNAVDSAKRYAATPPHNENRTAAVAAAWADLALVESKTGSPEPARQNAEKAMQMWGTIKKPGILTAYRNPMSHARAVLSIAP